MSDDASERSSAGRDSADDGADDFAENARKLGDEAGVYIPQDSAPSETDEEQTEAPIDFGGFLVSLGTSCMVNLGHAENPETGQTQPVNLPAAKQTIEILKMLREKTRGNLDPEEENLFESLLHDTQLAYEEAKEQHEGDAD